MGGREAVRNFQLIRLLSLSLVPFALTCASALPLFAAACSSLTLSGLDLGRDLAAITCRCGVVAVWGGVARVKRFRQISSTRTHSITTPRHHVTRRNAPCRAVPRHVVSRHVTPYHAATPRRTAPRGARSSVWPQSL